jgi:hypothetical protein
MTRHRMASHKSKDLGSSQGSFHQNVDCYQRAMMKLAANRLSDTSLVERYEGLQVAEAATAGQLQKCGQQETNQSAHRAYDCETKTPSSAPLYEPDCLKKQTLVRVPRAMESPGGSGGSRGRRATHREASRRGAEQRGRVSGTRWFKRQPSDILPNVTGSDCFMDSLLVALLLPVSCTVKCWLASDEAFSGTASGGGGGGPQGTTWQRSGAGSPRWPGCHGLRVELRRIQACLRGEAFCGERCRAALTAGTRFARGQQDPSEWLMHLLEQSKLPALFQTRDSEIKTYERAPDVSRMSFNNQYVQQLLPEAECDAVGTCRPRFPLLYTDLASPNDAGLKAKLKVTDYVKGNLVIFTSDKSFAKRVEYYDRVHSSGLVTLSVQDYKRRKVTLQLVSAVCWNGLVSGASSAGHYTCYVLPPSGVWHFFDDLGGGFQRLHAPPPALFGEVDWVPAAHDPPPVVKPWNPATSGTMFFYTLLSREAAAKDA